MKQTEYASIGFYGKDTKTRFNLLLNEYKNIYTLVNPKINRPTTSEILEGLCDVLENDITQLKESLKQNL